MVGEITLSSSATSIPATTTAVSAASDVTTVIPAKVERGATTSNVQIAGNVEAQHTVGIAPLCEAEGDGRVTEMRPSVFLETFDMSQPSIKGPGSSGLPSWHLLDLESSNHRLGPGG